MQPAGVVCKISERYFRSTLFETTENRLEKARAAIGDAKGKLKVGIVWSGSTTFKGNHDRAVPLRMFLDSFVLPGVQLFSLQKRSGYARLRLSPPVE
jgi:hypothetical protein